MSEEWANTALPRSLKGTKLSPPHPNILPTPLKKKKKRTRTCWQRWSSSSGSAADLGVRGAWWVILQVMQLQTAFWTHSFLVLSSLILWCSDPTGMHLVHRGLLFLLRKGQLCGRDGFTLFSFLYPFISLLKEALQSTEVQRARWAWLTCSKTAFHARACIYPRSNTTVQSE